MLTRFLQDCAPNLTILMGETLGARLIARAGSLTNLAKFPASTVQILGAEKALFRYFPVSSLLQLLMHLTELLKQRETLPNTELSSTPVSSRRPMPKTRAVFPDTLPTRLLLLPESILSPVRPRFLAFPQLTFDNRKPRIYCRNLRN